MNICPAGFTYSKYVPRTYIKPVPQNVIDFVQENNRNALDYRYDYTEQLQNCGHLLKICAQPSFVNIVSGP